MVTKPEDFSLPMAAVSRIVKDSLPDGATFSKEAKLALMKATCVFILYCTTCSNEFAVKSKRKTLQAEDVFQALEDMDFSEFIPQLRLILDKYRDSLKEKNERKRKPTLGGGGVSEQFDSEDVPSMEVEEAHNGTDVANSLVNDDLEEIQVAYENENVVENNESLDHDDDL